MLADSGRQLVGTAGRQQGLNRHTQVQLNLEIILLDRQQFALRGELLRDPRSLSCMTSCGQSIAMSLLAWSAVSAGDSVFF